MQSVLEEQAQRCSEQGNQYSTCYPANSDVWTNGTTHNFVWNFNNPFYVLFDELSLYLYYIVRYEYVSVKNFTNLPERSGGIEVTVDDSWFLTSLSPGSPSQNLTMYGFFLPSSANPMEELASTSSQFPRPFNFTVTQIAPPGNTTNDTNNSTVSTTNGTNSTDTGANNSTNSSVLPNWAIAVIVIAVVALVCGATALVWTMLLSRKNKRNNKLLPIVGKTHHGGAGDSEKRQIDDLQSMHSQVKMTAFRSTESVPMSATTETGSTVGTLASRNQPLSSLAAHDPSKLSSSDALLLSLGRNNEWSSEEDEELRRRRLGEALLQRQLEEDGTSVKHAGRFTRVKSMAEMQKSAVFERPQP